MTTVPSIITDNSITAFIAGKNYVAKSSHPNFEAIKEELKAGAEDTARLASLFDIPKTIEVKSQGRVRIQNNTVLYDGQSLHTTLTTRMLAMLGEGFNIEPLMRFLEKLMQNPSHRAVHGLYDFLAATNIPITPEGDFLAYKKVRSDYLDIHSGTIRNAVGDEPRVPRNQVDEDPDRTCSYGLHVCSESYLSHFGSSGSSDRVVIVQVNPADVVAIPRDYNNAKMRCCGYKVIGEVAQSATKTVFNAPVMGAANFAPAAEPNVTEARLGFEPTGSVRKYDGVTVTFEGDEDWGWYALYLDHEVNLDADSAQEAIREFEKYHVEDVADYTATVRWLDDDGELGEVNVYITIPVDEAGDDDLFIAAAEDEGDVDYDTVRVSKITQVPGTERKRICE